jgi:hypothetical protein
LYTVRWATSACSATAGMVMASTPTDASTSTAASSRRVLVAAVERLRVSMEYWRGTKALYMHAAMQYVARIVQAINQEGNQ